MIKDAIRYRIQVQAVVERVEKVGRQWTTISEEPIDGSNKTTPIYGHTPEVEKTVQKEVTVFDQTVDSLDMAALVLVVNGLQKP